MQYVLLMVTVPACLSCFHLTPSAIHEVFVSSHKADFVQHDPLSSLNISNPQDCHNHPELKRKLYSALAEGDEGELSIAIPKEVSLRQSGHGHFATSVASEGVHPRSNMGRLRINAVISCHPGASDAWPPLAIWRSNA